MIDTGKAGPEEAEVKIQGKIQESVRWQRTEEILDHWRVPSGKVRTSGRAVWRLLGLRRD